MDVSIPGRRVRGSKQNGSGGHQVVLVQNAGGRCAGAREAGAGCYSRFLGDGGSRGRTDLVGIRIAGDGLQG